MANWKLIYYDFWVKQEKTYLYGRMSCQILVTKYNLLVPTQMPTFMQRRKHDSVHLELENEALEFFFFFLLQV